MEQQVPLWLAIATFGLAVLGALFTAMRFSAKHSAEQTTQNQQIAHLEGRVEELKDGTNERLKEQKDCLAETGAILLRNDKEIEVLQKLLESHLADGARLGRRADD